MNLETRPLWKRIIAIILPIAGVLLVIQSALSVYNLWRKGDIVGEKRAEMHTLELKQEQLKKELSRTNTDTFIEEEARNKLGLIKPGETVVYVNHEATMAGKSVLDEQIQDNKPLPPLQQWVKLFF